VSPVASLGEAIREKGAAGTNAHQIGLGTGFFGDLVSHAF
jgi:hypothetical protein